MAANRFVDLTYSWEPNITGKSPWVQNYGSSLIWFHANALATGGGQTYTIVVEQTNIIKPDISLTPSEVFNTGPVNSSGDTYSALSFVSKYIRLNCTINTNMRIKAVIVGGGV